MALGLGELDEIRPFLAQAGNRLLHARPEGSVRMPVKKLDAADPRRLDGGDVRREPLLRGVPADDVKPRLRRAVIGLSPQERGRQPRPSSDRRMLS